MYLKFIYKPFLVYVPEIQNWLIDLQFWLTEVNHAKISHILLTSYIYLVSALPGYIDLFWLQNYCFWFTCQVFFFLNCAFKDLHSKRGEMEKKQAAVSIRIVNLWECGATKLRREIVVVVITVSCLMTVIQQYMLHWQLRHDIRILKRNY